MTDTRRWLDGRWECHIIRVLPNQRAKVKLVRDINSGLPEFEVANISRLHTQPYEPAVLPENWE